LNEAKEKHALDDNDLLCSRTGPALQHRSLLPHSVSLLHFLTLHPPPALLCSRTGPALQHRPLLPHSVPFLHICLPSLPVLLCSHTGPALQHQSHLLHSVPLLHLLTLTTPLLCSVPAQVQPRSIGQASHIGGVNPADISALLVHLEVQKRRSDAAAAGPKEEKKGDSSLKEKATAG